MFKQEKKDYVFDKNGKKYITARGIVNEHNLENNVANRKIATGIMHKIARKYRWSKEPVMSESDDARAEYQALMKLHQNDKPINKDDLEKLIDKYKYEQKNQREYTPQSIKELSNDKFEEIINTAFPGIAPNNINQTNLRKAINQYLDILRSRAHKKFFPHTENHHGLDYNIFLKEFETHNENLFDPIYDYKENNHIYRTKAEADAKGSGINPDYDYKNDEGIILFKQMLVEMGYQPSNPQELLIASYKLYNEQYDEVQQLQQKYQEFEDSIVISKRIPNNIDDNDVTNPFLTAQELKTQQQAEAKEIKRHPYLTDKTGQKYDEFKKWLDADPQNRPQKP